MILRRSHILVILVFSQFACISLWFAVNGVMEDLIASFTLTPDSIGHLTSAVQLGFITGTLLFALLALADRYSPSRVFFISAILASGFNLTIIFSEGSLVIIYLSRFLTGFFLAGIYPVGMKIAADYYDKELGKALGFLLGALVLGTAFPHLLRSRLQDFSWETVLQCTSVFAIAGGILVFFLIPDGPYRKKQINRIAGSISRLFVERKFKAAAFGYFGHMWELYAFWTFIPIALHYWIPGLTTGNISLLSFFVIAIGSLGCIIGGLFVRKAGSFKIAFIALAFSGICCMLSPLLFLLPQAIIIFFFLFWGAAVIADSPQFSTLVAQNAPAENKATALTIVNCIGFSITIVSIQLLNILSGTLSHQWLFLILLPGPVLGLLAMTYHKVAFDL